MPEAGGDGCILTFSSTHPHGSFAKTDPDGGVTAVSEKRPIRCQATTGFYYLRRAADFLQGAESVILKGLRTSGQFFVCPVFRRLSAVATDVRLSSHGTLRPETPFPEPKSSPSRRR